jgi:hypothetical protein
MNITHSTPRENRVFAGQALTCPAPYTPGHVLTDPEASFMNTYVGSAVGNRFAAALKTALEDAKGDLTAAVAASKFATLQEWFDAAYNSFEPGVAKRAANGTGTSTKSDPVLSLARSFAELDLIAKIHAKFGPTGVAKARKTKMEDGRTKFTHWLDDQFNRAKEDYMDRARAQMEESTANAVDDESEALEDFSLD